MNNKNSSLKILYIFLLGFFYLIYNYIIPIGSGMALYSAGVFMFICLGLYLSDNMKFDIPHYRVNKFFVKPGELSNFYKFVFLCDMAYSYLGFLDNSNVFYVYCHSGCFKHLSYKNNI